MEADTVTQNLNCIGKPQNIPEAQRNQIQVRDFNKTQHKLPTETNTYIYHSLLLIICFHIQRGDFVLSDKTNIIIIIFREMIIIK